MLNGKFFAILIGMIVAILAIWNITLEHTPSVLENFQGMPQRTVKRMPIVKASGGQEFALANNYNQMMAASSGFPGLSYSNNYNATKYPGKNLGSIYKDSSESFVHKNNSEEFKLGENQMYMTPPNFQNSLSPRFSSQGYGAYINYNLPDEQFQGVPKNPLTFGKMVSNDYQENTDEGFCASGGCGSVASCNSGGTTPNAQLNARAAMNSMQMDYSNPSYAAANAQAPSSGEFVDELPVHDMSVLGSDGTVGNPVVYDRFIFANQRSRLRGLGCPLRGDNAPVPCNTGWFQVSVTPHIDLQQGAMAVMGGLNNDSAKALYDLSLVSSGGYDTSIAGVNLSESIDLSTSKVGFAGAGTQDLQFTAFP
jgi:hypothetical protein